MRRHLLFLLLGIITFFISNVRADTRHVVTQSTYSDCGPAALATLLNYYLDVPTTENEMMKLSGLDPLTGTTFLRLEEAAVAKNCEADSFRMTPEVLAEQMKTYPVPVIVRTLVPEPHFSVLLGIKDNNFLLADPGHGNIVLRKSAFLQRWLIPGLQEGFVFIVARSDEHWNQARVDQKVRDLLRQMRKVQQIRPPLMPAR